VYVLSPCQSWPSSRAEFTSKGKCCQFYFWLLPRMVDNHNVCVLALWVGLTLTRTTVFLLYARHLSLSRSFSACRCVAGWHAVLNVRRQSADDDQVDIQ
jgi:hypothetical protein